MISDKMFERCSEEEKQNYRDWASGSGIYSKDPNIAFAARLKELISEASKGSTSSLNILWSFVKDGRLHKDEYYIISEKYERAV
jgi:hypothetical protein